MKTKALLFAICSLPLVLTAASSLQRHQAFGALRFGMSEKEAQDVFQHIHHGKDPHSMTAADARPLFVTNGALRVSRMSDYDRALPVFVAFHAAPFVDQVSIDSLPKTAAEYDGLKKAWEDFQDLGDSKFLRRGEKGTFSAMATVDAAPLDPATHTKTVITDTWETEGVRIELAVQYVDPSATTYMTVPPRYRVALIATEAAPTK
jgi:hypothetical protein